MIEPSKPVSAGGKTYSPREIRELLQKLASLGINQDKIIAQINPREAAILKRLGGSGKINPRTGLISFDDEGGGDGGDGGDGGGGDGSDGDGSGGNGTDDGSDADDGSNTDDGSDDESDNEEQDDESDLPALNAQEAKFENRVQGITSEPNLIDQAIQAGYIGAPQAYSPSYGDLLTGVTGIGNATAGGLGLSGASGSTYGAWGGQGAVTEDQLNATISSANAAAQAAAEREASAQAAIDRSAATSDAPLFENGTFLTAAQQAAVQAENAREEARQAAAEKNLDQFLQEQDQQDARLGLSATSPGAPVSALSSLAASLAFDPDLVFNPAPIGSQKDSLTPAFPGNLFEEPINTGFFTGASFVPAGPTYADVPLPPERPADLPLYADVPLPPERPAEFPEPTGQMTQQQINNMAAGLNAWIASGKPVGLPVQENQQPSSSLPPDPGWASRATAIGNDLLNEAKPGSSPTPYDWNAWAEKYNASQLLPFDFEQPDVIQGVINAAPSSREPAAVPSDAMVPPADIPFAQEKVSPVAAEPDLSGSAIVYDSGGSEPVPVAAPASTPIGEVAATPLVASTPAVETTSTETPTAAPVLPKQFIDWLHYGERNPEFAFYQTNRVKTPYAAHGGYFDADAYFADGGLVSSPRAPVQPTVATMPTMAYTDGQGLVGSIAAPPGLTPYDSYGSDAEHASPMAPSPAAAAPSFEGPLQSLAAKNTNAAPVRAPIPQNPNLGYSLGVSPISRLRG